MAWFCVWPTIYISIALDAKLFVSVSVLVSGGGGGGKQCGQRERDRDAERERGSIASMVKSEDRLGGLVFLSATSAYRPCGPRRDDAVGPKLTLMLIYLCLGLAFLTMF